MPVCKVRLRVTTPVYGMKPKSGFRNTFLSGADGTPCNFPKPMVYGSAGGTVWTVVLSRSGETSAIMLQAPSPRRAWPHREAHARCPACAGSYRL